MSNADVHRLALDASELAGAAHGLVVILRELGLDDSADMLDPLAERVATDVDRLYSEDNRHA